MAPVSSRVEARPDDVVVIYVIRHGQSRWNVARERCAASGAQNKADFDAFRLTRPQPYAGTTSLACCGLITRSPRSESSRPVAERHSSHEPR